MASRSATSNIGDFDSDSDVDCDDWGSFVVAWTAAGTPAPLPSCQSAGLDPSKSPLAGLALTPPWPNPSRGEIRFGYALSVASPVRLAVHDVTGGVIRRLVDEMRPAGNHSHVWNGVDEHGRRPAPGVYFVRLATEGVAASRLFVLAE